MNVSVVADQIKQKLVGAVLAPPSWQLTQSRNTGAFYASSGSSQKPLLNIYLTDPYTPYYASTSPTAGFDFQGNPCNQFNSESGSDACPFRYEVRLVSRTMQGSNWIDTVGFAMTFKPSSNRFVLNAQSAKYTFNLVRNFDTRGLEAPCISINGQYNPNDNTCSVSLKREKTCANGTSYKGPAENDCATKTLPTKTCTSPNVIKGFDNQGNSVCGPPT